MSALARYFRFKGLDVSGYDKTPTALTDVLQKEGIRVHFEDNAEFVPKEKEDTLVVYTPAIPEDMGELVYVMESGYNVLKRSRVLGEITRGQKCLAVAGTHGKTTTTSMISEILLQAGTDPTISVGGIYKPIGGNIRVGGSEYFVTEACEYTNSFLSFFPTVGIILNIEEDHMDFFKDLADIRHSFRKFAELLPADGCLIINADIPDYREITDGLTCKVITCSMRDTSADYYPSDITHDTLGHPSFNVHTGVPGAEPVRSVSLSVPGDHNVGNALTAIALADLLGVETETTRKALLSFTGTDRRFELKGRIGDITIIDDYAHHPTEITATLKAAQNYPHNTLWCVFQPHTYTRTRALLKEFAEALSQAENLVLADIPEVKGVALSDLLHDFLTTNADIAVCWSLEPLQLAQP